MDTQITKENWESWGSIVQPLLVSPEMKSLKAKLKEEREKFDVFPSNIETFNAFKLTNYNDLKIVIIGEDPYPTPGHAHGLAFSSLGTEIPKSLQNIFKEIRTNLYNFMSDEEFNKYFAKPDLTNWAKQGILLLNRCLTVRSGEAGSHSALGWDFFTDSVVKKLNEHKNKIVFILWGSEAQELEHYITDKKHLVLTSAHPSPLSAHKGFIGNNHFLKASNFLIQNNNIEKVKVNFSEYVIIDKFKKFMLDNGIAETTDFEQRMFNDGYHYTFVKTIDFRTSNI